MSNVNTIKKVNIIGAGLAGLSAAITLARNGIASNLISSMPSERAQSVLAEGGINAAMDVMGEKDTAEEHYADTMAGGCYLESEANVRALTSGAPDVVRELIRLGVPFNRENGSLIQRNFGGQKKKRTAYAKSSTGKVIMTALIDEARKYEHSGLIIRWPHHKLVDISVKEKELESITILDTFSGKGYRLSGQTILCTGGLNGFFEGATTGTTQNTGDAAAIAFAHGVSFANLEFIQYHPTTVEISGKRMLVSEAARGEGGRLFTIKNGEKWYFMEEKYPSLGNLMPRDVISREIALLKNEDNCTGEVFLDLTGLDERIWSGKLSDMRSEIISYLKIDPKTDPVPVAPGIHFFMGGIRVDHMHRTNIGRLYAAGEAAAIYHGANRLGGNSMLGAIFGGSVAAGSALRQDSECVLTELGELNEELSSPDLNGTVKDALLNGLGIIRDPESMNDALLTLEGIRNACREGSIDRNRALLAEAMVRSAAERRESRGAHYRADFPSTDDGYKKRTVALFDGNDIKLSFRSAEEE